MSIDRRIFLKRSLLLISGDLLYGCDSSTGIGDRSTPAADTGFPPSIKIQPSDKLVFSGERATFYVLAEGAEPFSYQWKKNDINISGASSSSYTTPFLELVDTATSYSVEVTNRYGFVVSRNAILSVTQATQLKITADLTSITIDSSQITIDRT